MSILSCYYAINNSASDKIKWYYDSQPLLPNRSGLSFLQEHNIDSALHELFSILDGPDLGVNVDFHLRFLGTSLDAQEREKVFQTLVNAVAADANNSDSLVRANVKYAPQALTTGETYGCQESDLDELVPDSNHKGYNIFVASGCEESILEIHEDGNMHLRLASKDANEASRLNIFENEVPELIHEMLYMDITDGLRVPTQLKKHKKSKLRLMVSVVDPDPETHGSQRQDAIEHSQRLNQMLVQSMELMEPMFEKLGPFLDIAMSTHHLPYHGRDFSHSAVQNEYDDDTIDFIVSNQNAADYFLHGEIAHLTGGLLSPDIITADSNEETVQLVLYLPEAHKQPLFVEDAELSWGAAFSIPEKNLAVAILNLPDLNPKVNDEAQAQTETEDLTNSEEVSLDDVYQKEIKVALSYFGTFLREKAGLSPYQPHSIELTADNLTVRHIRAKHGVALWEVESLARNSIWTKAETALSILNNIYKLTLSRPRLCLPQMTAERMLKSIELLNHALELINNDGDIKEIIILLNEANDLTFQIMGDEDTFELPYVANDQLFAVFGSLLVPVLVPILKNLISEKKRYKMKMKKHARL